MVDITKQRKTIDSTNSRVDFLHKNKGLKSLISSVFTNKPDMCADF